jgi:CubicO group peptidase (beta-lactamase class C family)
MASAKSVARSLGRRFIALDYTAVKAGSMTLTRRCCLAAFTGSIPLAGAPRRFPGRTWDTRSPSAVGLDPRPLDQIAELLAGRGCIVKDGAVVAAWGDQAESGDWLSSAKPVLTTLLLFAIGEGKASSLETTIDRYGWNLQPKDRGIRFSHLANMTSGYARPEAPGKAWAYNDYAIQLYQLTLFDRVFREEPDQAAMNAKRLGALGFADGLHFDEKRRRLHTSVRDFARIAWFWLSGANWNGVQLLPPRLFRRCCRPHVSRGLAHTAKAETNDYLGIGTFGGGSDHFTEFGAGIYGSNWWFNASGRLHPDAVTWPSAPPDTFMSIGARGNCAMMIPSLGLALVAARANWGTLSPGETAAPMNRCAQFLSQALKLN